MNLPKNSDAEKAYLKGKGASIAGKSFSDNPHHGRRFLGLSNWWAKGFNDQLIINNTFNQETHEQNN